MTDATIEQQGQGDPTLVLVHGFPLDRSLWQGQAPLSRSARLVVLDLPGFGDTPAAQMTGGLAGYSSAVLAAMDRAGLERATLCGISMGGYVLFDLWRRAAHRIAGLVLCDTRADADTPQVKLGREQSIALVRSGQRREVTDGMLDRLLGARSRQRSELVQQTRAMMERASDDGIVAALQAMRERPDSTADLARITVPTLVVVGAEDVLTPPEVAQQMSDGIAGSRLVVIPDAGHLSPLENPEAFNHALAGFVGSAPERRGMQVQP